MSTPSISNNETSFNFNATGIPQSIPVYAPLYKPSNGTYVWHLFRKGNPFCRSIALVSNPQVFLSWIVLNNLPHQGLSKRKAHKF